MKSDSNWTLLRLTLPVSDGLVQGGTGSKSAEVDLLKLSSFKHVT